MSLAFFGHSFGEQEQRCHRPHPENQSADNPEISVPAAVARHDSAKDGIQSVNQSRRQKQRSGFHVWLDEEKTGEIAEEMVKVH